MISLSLRRVHRKVFVRFLSNKHGHFHNYTRVNAYNFSTQREYVEQKLSNSISSNRIKSLKNPSVDFNNTLSTFQHSKSADLIRALLILRIFSFEGVVKHAEKILKASLSIFGKHITFSIIKHTFFKQFCAGETPSEVGVRVKQLKNLGVHGIFDYAAEEDCLTLTSSPGSNSPPTAVARQYNYDGESLCDAHAENFLECIRAVSDQSPGGFAAVKLTALGDPFLLRQFSKCIVELEKLFHRLDDGFTGRITPEQFETGYQRLFRLESLSDHAYFNELTSQLSIHDRLNHRTVECIDYIDWSNHIKIEDLPRISLACREAGPFSNAVKSIDSNGLVLLCNMRKRIEMLSSEAKKCGVRLMIDAEQSSTQPIIDNIVCSLQQEYNTLEGNAYPTIFGTYQCYLKDAPKRVKNDIERAKRLNYTFSCKVVRGAYMDSERNIANELGAPSPICETIEDTHENYRVVTDLILEYMGSGHPGEVMFATHNQASIEYVLEKMQQEGLGVNSGVNFGQLLGMGDHLSFALGNAGYKVYKYLPYGKVSEVIPYLLRRAKENSGVLSGAIYEQRLIRKELWRRIIY